MMGMAMVLEASGDAVPVITVAADFCSGKCVVYLRKLSQVRFTSTAANLIQTWDSPWSKSKSTHKHPT